MPNRDWLRYLALVGLQALGLFAIAQIGVSVWSEYVDSSREYREYRQQAEAEQNKAAHEIASRCNIIFEPGQSLASCIAQEINAYQKQDTTDKDLKAQQDMALWGLGTVLVGALGLVISVGGLFMLWQSLNQTRQAISNDREIGHAQIRAYVSVFDFETIVTDDPRPVIKTTIVFKNTGQTPAKKLRVNADWAAGETPFDETLHPHRVEKFDGRGAVSSGATFFANLNTEKGNFRRALGGGDIEKVISGEWKFWVFGVIEYVDVFNEPRKTRFRYEIMIHGTQAGFSPCLGGNEES